MALTQVQPAMLGTPQPYSFKNRIINGAMVIDQRNAGASISTTGGFFVDRWIEYFSGGGVYSAQQSSTAPTGFVNSSVLTVTTVDSSIAAGDYYMIRHNIEGYNIADLNWGTANAKTVTLSFWVQSSVTGTYGGSLTNSAENRSYPFTYTISSANTWQQISITIAGDTTGTWLTTNGRGIGINFGLGMGSTYSGTAGSWAGAAYLSATGATNWIATSGATFYITGVQLEVGSSATGFDYRAYGTELALCQRYYYKVQSGIYSAFAMGFNASTTSFTAFMVLPVTMRIAATNLEYSNLQTYDPSGGNYLTTALSVSASSSTNNMAGLSGSFTGPSTSTYPCILRASNSASGYIALNAEL